MVICGIKLTHDAAVAIVEDGVLVAQHEVEKHDNNLRYSDLKDTDLIDEILAEEGYSPRAIDSFVIDGWGWGESEPVVNVNRSGVPGQLTVAPYRESGASHVLRRVPFRDTLNSRWGCRDYASYTHVATHVMSAYCSSPFAWQQRPALVLVWDGGVLPRLYGVECDGELTVTSYGPIFGLMGNLYPVMATHVDPFVPDPTLPASELETYQLSVPGKVMAYTALGAIDPDIISIYDQIYDEDLELSLDFAQKFAVRVRKELPDAPGADVLASLQAWMGNLLVSSLERSVDRYHDSEEPLAICLVGGCALNIKWNSAVRESGIFEEVWVPPFTNDSGSAIGAACAEMAHMGMGSALKWSVYGGPRLRPSAPAPGWTASQCSRQRLARLLHEEGEPTVVLDGRAELGPRALGHRSVIAPAVDASMKDDLNSLKGRERYRPVSPICSERRAQEIFRPGTRDPYMLFDHRIRAAWERRIPAIVHLDGSARLQTISSADSVTITELLDAYEAISGIPVLCNTSANYEGRGFFPDVHSATAWGRTKYVWSEETLYTQDGWGGSPWH